MFLAEYCDEFGQVAARARYENGRAVESAQVPPRSLAWIEWEEAEE